MNACRMMSPRSGHWLMTCLSEIAGDLVDLAVAAGDGGDDRRRAGQVRDVAGELARAVDGDRLRLVAGLVEDLDLAGANDEEFEVAVADLDENVARGMLRDPGAGATAELGDLLVGQRWKGNFVEIELSHGPWYTLSQNRTRRIPRPRYPRTGGRVSGLE